MNHTCANIHPPLPPVINTANQSSTFTLTPYKPNTGGLTQILSTALSQSTFSTNDVHTLLNKLIQNDAPSWSTSEVTKFNPIVSVIIYTSITLALFLIFAIVFCIISCRNSYKAGYRGPSKVTQVCACLLIFVYLLGIGDMFYVVYRINLSKTSIDETVKQVNQEIYPREISEHVTYLTKQLNRLDQYCTEPKSILINASKSIFLNTFDQILNEKYYIDEILHSIGQTGEHLQELNTTIEQHTDLPPEVKNAFREFQDGYESMMDAAQLPIEEVCLYANGSKTEIDQKLVDALNVVHTQLRNVNETIQRGILRRISPWEQKVLLSTDTEEQIRSYANTVGILCMVLVLVLGMIPVSFLLPILISRFCGGVDFDKDDDRVPMEEMSTITPGGRLHPSRANKVVPVYHYQKRSRSRSSNPSRVPLCLMRLAFSLMFIILVLLTLFTGVYYALDLALHAGCRTIHDDQPYLINLLASQHNDTIVIFGNNTALNTTVSDLLDDCRNGKHFSEKLLKNYWSILNEDMTEMLKTLSREVHAQFIQAIGDIDVPGDMNLLTNLTELANATDIAAVIGQIEGELETMNGYFEKINASNGTLPAAVVQSTINQFEDYLKLVLNSTLDGCPLPVTTISQADTLVCQTLASSVNGLWLSILIFMLITTLGLSICGLCVYKKVSP